MQVTVGSKYQIVIPKEVRKKIKGLRPGPKVDVMAMDSDTVVVKANPTDWVERTRGIATEAWKDIDPIKELEKMRDEWEYRLKELHKSVK